ncbi:ABC transporter ATP-binding protein [Agrobacterium rosae]|uniref:ABC transporter ATP-binding protein n=1 Tax=Agrobacterium rosae TaxID=1972867 RepID=A0AAW9FCS7_9HYPH|nr:ABC transporter ATP-binding protein [Agrobacterium rosae]MDX8304457.1 ABC transporter ATP-binding protein [Agrobacterium rosae]
MLEVTQLRSGFGRIPIIGGVDLGVAPGELLGILGHNGAGKTTLLKTLAGFLPVTDGSIRLEGRDIASLPPYARARAGMGYVPQGRRIFPALSVRENLEIAAARSGRSIEEVLELFPRIVRLLDRAGGALSGGEQQLLALARCLCARPKIMLLDEPTEGIQPSIIEEMIETLLRIRKSDGLTILLVEQNLECLQALADRILVLNRGVIVKELRGADVHDRDALAEIMM